ncbi:uncharacterized protein JCM6883_003950 [Sporobolomyces salmoneus]|uniref:uncharacterized protein n=1 Tax=Sporobolomyces salmoneus TaxID=183962 RepID=UPI0031811F27
MLASSILPLALVGAASMIPSASASPIHINGQAPTVTGSDGSISQDLLQRGFDQAVERSIAQLSERAPKTDKECSSKARRSRKDKRFSRSAVPLINQADLVTFAPAQIGTPYQDAILLVDTGSADILVPRATAEYPSGSGGFDTSKSRTFRKGDGSETLFSFGVGSAMGTVVHDKVNIGGFIQIAHPFGLISPDAIGKGALGVLGLSFGSISKINGGITFFDRLIRDKSLVSNLFGLFHSRGGVSGSQLTLGAIDSTRYEGELTTVPVKAQSQWTIQMNQATIDGEAVFDGPVYSAVDSGATYTIIPKAITDAYFARVPGSVANPEHNITTTISGATVVGQIYEYPCDAEIPELGFVFDGAERNFNIASDDMYILQSKASGLCTASIIGADVNYYGQKAALLGVSFLKNWYSVFNHDDATVSFASAKH